MSVLVKDWHIPKDCRICPFMRFDSSDGETICCMTINTLATDYKPIPFEGRAEDCPLVEAPEQKQEKWYPLVNWMPTKEVIAFNDMHGSYGYHEYLIGYIRDDPESDTGFSCESDSETLMNVTHWMPLPEPPKDGDSIG